MCWRSAWAVAPAFTDIWALSEFTAERFRKVHRVDASVIRPIFQPEEYRVAVDGRHVTFINPVAEKGVDRALEIAALCPEIPFVFVRGWALSFAAARRLQAKIDRLSNVRLVASTYDIRSIHRHTKILLAPTSSIWEETWGRVVSEAQISGIPVIASNHGALPESVGSGGILIDYQQPAETWAMAVRRLWTDEAYYRQMAAAAHDYSRRPDIDPNRQITLLENSLTALLRRAAE